MVYKKKVKRIDNIEVKIKVKADLQELRQDRLEEQDKIAARIQKKLNSWWSKQTTKPFILIADYGNLAKGTDTFCYKVELTQLNLDKETIDKFKKGAEQQVKEYLFGTDFEN